MCIALTECIFVQLRSGRQDLWNFAVQTRQSALFKLLDDDHDVVRCRESISSIIQRIRILFGIWHCTCTACIASTTILHCEYVCDDNTYISTYYLVGIWSRILHNRKKNTKCLLVTSCPASKREAHFQRKSLSEVYVLKIITMHRFINFRDTSEKLVLVSGQKSSRSKSYNERFKVSGIFLFFCIQIDSLFGKNIPTG